MATTIKHDAEFVKFVKGYIEHRLDELDGLCTYGCELGFDLSLDVNNDLPLMWKDDGEALEFIARYPNSALATVDCVKWHEGEEGVAHMLRNWRVFAFRMLYEACNCIACQMPLVEHRWNDELELTEDIVARLKHELARIRDIEY